ncbi:zf-HC2 domain-containing protein [bacterium]|nr:zf-HC2 domain-containing protein [bacterium]
MNCLKIKKLLPGFLDSELEQEKEELVRQHLSTCSECSSEAKLLANAWNLLNKLETIKPSKEARAEFWEKTESEELDKFPNVFSWNRFLFRWSPVMVAAVLLVFSLFYKDYLPNSHDKEIVKNIEMLENLEILENLDLLTDLPVVKEESVEI